MKEGFRQSMAWLHSWLGLIVGWVLFFVYLTGTLGYLDTEIDYWMKPDRPYFAEVPPLAQQVELAQQRLTAVAPDAATWNIQLLGGRDAPALTVAWTLPPDAANVRGKTQKLTLDPRSGEPIDYSARATGGGQVLYQMHYYLAYLPPQTAITFIIACTVVMLAAMITGIIVHKNIFKDFFTFRPGKGQRSWLDGHNLLSVGSLPFHLMITYSGLLFFLITFTPLVPKLLLKETPGRSVVTQMYEGTFGVPGPQIPAPTGQATPVAALAPMLAVADEVWGKNKVTALEVRNVGDSNARVILKPLPGDTVVVPDYSLVLDGITGKLLDDFHTDMYPAGRADFILKGLHRGLFADWFLRILYLFMGFCGTAMIATGLLLWSNKRKTKLLANGEPLHFGIHLVDRLNLGTIIGSLVAVAAYFWANRLLPIDLPARAKWEVHVMYLTWLLLFIYPAVRPLHKARVEMLWICAAAFLLLPLVNALTTTRHLGVSLAQGDWGMAGVDLSCIAGGVLALWFARRMPRNAPQTNDKLMSGVPVQVGG